MFQSDRVKDALPDLSWALAQSKMQSGDDMCKNLRIKKYPCSGGSSSFVVSSVDTCTAEAELIPSSAPRAVGPTRSGGENRDR